MYNTKDIHIFPLHFRFIQYSKTTRFYYILGKQFNWKQMRALQKLGKNLEGNNK